MIDSVDVFVFMFLILDYYFRVGDGFYFFELIENGLIYIGLVCCVYIYLFEGLLCLSIIGIKGMVFFYCFVELIIICVVFVRD